jgi:hypothetical protein
MLKRAFQEKRINRKASIFTHKATVQIQEGRGACPLAVEVVSWPLQAAAWGI